MKKCHSCPRKHRSKFKTCLRCRKKRRASTRKSFKKRMEWMRKHDPAGLKAWYRANNQKKEAARARWRKRNARRVKKWHKHYSKDWNQQAGPAYKQQRRLIARALSSGELKRPKKCSKCGKKCKPNARTIPGQELPEIKFYCWPCLWKLTNGDN